MNYEADSKRFAVAINLLEVTFNSDFDKGRIRAYFSSLEDLQIDAIEYAVKECAKREKRTPPPAVIREYAAMSGHQQQQKFTPKALNLFNESPATPFGRASLKLINDLFGEVIDKQQYLIRCTALLEENGRDTSWIAEQWEETASGY